MHSRSLRISDLIRDTCCATGGGSCLHRGAGSQGIPRLEVPKAKGRYSYRFPAKAARAQK